MIKSVLAQVDELASKPRAVVGASAARALLGFVGFMFYLGQYHERGYLFSPDGLLAHDEFKRQLQEAGTFSLYSWSSSPLWFELVFHAGALAALAVMLGVGGRATLAIHWVLLWSIFQRQTALLDGGDNLAYIVIPMLLLTKCYDRFSFSTGSAATLAKKLPGAARSLSAPLHNLGVIAVAAQICLVYIVSGLYKVQGEVWQDGTALFYILRVSEFELPGISNLIYENDLLVYMGTYATVLFMVYFPVGILVPRLRPWVATASIGFHLSIAIVMGLTGFALTMVACDLVFLSGVIDRTVNWVKNKMSNAPDDPTTPVPVEPAPVGDEKPPAIPAKY